MKVEVVFLLTVSLLAGTGMVRLPAQTLTPTQAHDDLLYLRYKLETLHPGLGYYTPKARMEQVFDSLYNTINNPVGYLPFFRHLAPYINGLKDGHTNLNHRKNYINKHTRFVPFYIRLADGRYYISHNVSADSLLVRGTELVEINGRRVAAIHQTLAVADHTGSDGDNLTGRLQNSLNQFADYYAAWFGSTDTVAITYRLPSDTLLSKTRLACPTALEFRTLLTRRYQHEFDQRANLSVTLVDTLTHTAVLRVSSFMSLKRYDPFQWAYKRRVEQAFAQIRALGVQNLIVDVQNNGGGIVLNSARLLQYWMPEPFMVMAHEQLKHGARRELVGRRNLLSAVNFALHYKSDGQGGFSERKGLLLAGNRWFRPRAYNTFRGNLYFLVNGASFSATTSVLAKTLDAGLGTFVGEATGSAYWGDFAGYFNFITLPNSRIQLRIPLKKLTHDVTPDRANGLTVEPDYSVERTYTDLVTGRDHALTYTLGLIRQGIVARKPLLFRPFQAIR